VDDGVGYAVQVVVIGERVELSAGAGARGFTRIVGLREGRGFLLEAAALVFLAAAARAAFQRDAHGNVLVKTEYAGTGESCLAFADNSAILQRPRDACHASHRGHLLGLSLHAARADEGGWAANATAGDRVTLAAYDSHGNVTEVTQVNDPKNVSRFMSYDAAGRLAKTWQGVTGNDGIAHTLYTAFEYDALGRAHVSEAGLWTAGALMWSGGVPGRSSVTTGSSCGMSRARSLPKVHSAPSRSEKRSGLPPTSAEPFRAWPLRLSCKRAARPRV
jgi:hypothetical protein